MARTICLIRCTHSSVRQIIVVKNIPLDFIIIFVGIKDAVFLFQKNNPRLSPLTSKLRQSRLSPYLQYIPRLRTNLNGWHRFTGKQVLRQWYGYTILCYGYILFCHLLSFERQCHLRFAR